MSRNQNDGSRQILAELESLLTQPIEPTPAEVEAAHGRALEAIRSANERLVSAYGLIAAGRRAEAIEIAEGPPHVLDEIAILDSQLIRDWEHWSGQFGLPRFAPLRNDLAAFLHNAYTSEKQNEHLLRRHRLLAIGRANLRPRIAVLSQLAASDPSNPHWKIALADYQRQRLEQLAQRATQARKFKDLRCLQQVMSELRQTRWLTPVLGAQVDSVQKQINQLQSRESTNEAIALAEHIQDAHASGDRERLIPLINRWSQIEPRVDKSALAELLPQVRGVIDWYDQDRLQQRKAEAQDKALNRIGKIKPNAQAKDIQSVIQGIALTGAQVPTELRETYRERLDQEKRARRFKTGAITAAIALVILGFTSLAAIIYRGQQRAAALTQTIDAIDNMYRENDLVAVERLLDTVPDDDPRFDKFRKRLSEKKLAEQLRSTEFQDDAAAIRTALAEATEEDAFDALKPRIARLANRAEQEDEFMTAREIINSSKKLRQQRRDDYIQSTMELSAQIRADLRTLAADDAARPTLTQWNLQLQQRRTNRWIRGESDVLEHLDETSNAIADRWDSIRELVEAEKSLSLITANVGDWDRWESLSAKAEDQEETVKGKYKAIARCTEEERGLWESIQQWNEISSKWTVDAILSASPEDAKEIQFDLRIVERMRLSDLPAAQDFLTAAQVAVPTAARGPRTLELLLAHLQSAKMSTIGALKVAATDASSARWHYFAPVRESLAERGKDVRIQHFTDLETIKTRPSTVPFSTVKLPADFADQRAEYLAGNRPLLAPHVSVCKSMRENIEGLVKDPNQWDQAFTASYRELSDADELDPLVQLFLINLLLDTGSRGSWVLAKAHDGHLQMIRDANVRTDVNWIDPTDQEAATAREEALALLRELRVTKPADPTPRLEEMKTILEINTQYALAGWLDQQTGEWLVRTGGDLPDSGRLYARFDDSGINKMTSVGRITDGEISLSSGSGAAMRIGRPVWFANDRR